MKRIPLQMVMINIEDVKKISYILTKKWWVTDLQLSTMASFHQLLARVLVSSQPNMPAWFGNGYGLEVLVHIGLDTVGLEGKTIFGLSFWKVKQWLLLETSWWQTLIRSVQLVMKLQHSVILQMRMRLNPVRSNILKLAASPVATVNYKEDVGKENEVEAVHPASCRFLIWREGEIRGWNF